MSADSEESAATTLGKEATTAPAQKKTGKVTARVLAAGQVAAAITAIVTVTVLLWNLVLKPAPTPPVIRAEATHVEVHPGVTLRTYLSDRPGPLERFLAGTHAGHDSQQEIDEVLSTHGTQLEFTVAVDGGLHRTLDLTTNIYDAKSDARVPEGEVVVQDPKRYRPEAESFQSTLDTWIQTPPRPGSYYAEVDIEEANGPTLATAKSPTFSIP
jgi:hypothetical protein